MSRCARVSAFTFGFDTPPVAAGSVVVVAVAGMIGVVGVGETTVNVRAFVV